MLYSECGKEEGSEFLDVGVLQARAASIHGIRLRAAAAYSWTWVLTEVSLFGISRSENELRPGSDLDIAVRRFTAGSLFLLVSRAMAHTAGRRI